MGLAPEIDVLIPALSQLPLAAAVTDGSGVVRWVNGRTESLTGYGRDEIIGRSVESPECPLHFPSSVTMEDLRADAPLEAEAAWTKKNGLTCAVSAAITPIKDHSGAVTHALWVFTPRSREEEELLRTATRYSAIFTSMAEGVVFQAADGRIEACNPSAERILGLTADQMAGRKSVDPRWASIHEDGSPFPGETHPAMVSLRTGEPLRNVVMGVHKPDGSLTWISINSQPLAKAGQPPYAVVTTFVDITERKITERLAAKKQQEFETFFNLIPDIACVLSADGFFKKVNPAFGAALGWSSEELLTTPFLEFNHPDDLAGGTAAASTHFSGRNATGFVGRYRHKDGSFRWLEWRATDVLDGQVFATALDITERKRAEEELKRAHAAAAEAELHFHRLFNGLSDAVFVLQLEGDIAQSRVIDANDAACSILGCTREEVLGRLATDFGAPENYRMAPAVAQRLGEAGKLTRETTLVAKDGRRIPVEVILQRFEGGGAALLLATARDITERKRAEAEIQRAHDDVAAAERHYRFLFESGSDAIFLHRRNPDGGPGETLDVNENACRYLGYTREELLQLEIADICVPEEVPALSARRPQLLADRQLVVEMTHVAKDGRRIPVEIHGRALEIGGAPVILSHVRDISERRRAEAAIQKSHEALAAAERHYRFLFESGSDAIFLHRIGPDGLPGEMLDANEIACRYLGYTKEELLRLDLVHLDPPEEHERVRERMERLLARGEAVWEMTHLAKDGRRVPIEVHTRVLSWEGLPVLLSHVRDISRRLEAERRYQDLFESAIEGIYSCSLEGRLLRANPAYAAMLGYESVDDLMSSVKDTGRQVWADARVRAAVLERLAAEGFLIGYEAQFKKKDGTPIWVSFNSQMVYGPDGRPASTQGFVVEITNRKRSEAQAAHLEEQLRQAQKLESVGRLAGGIAHEFNNLLTVINGYSELLLDRLHPSDPLRRCAQAIMDSGDRAASLTRQLLGFGRRQLARPRALDLNATVASFAGMIRSVLGEKFSLATDLDGSLGEVMADPDQVNQVLMNLVLNARDAMPQGGSVRIATANAEFDADSISAHDAEAAAGRYVRLSVTDTGHGMDEETRQRVFEPFFTTKAVGEGAGLGLATVFGIAHQNGGWVEAESELGEGSCFSVYLPRTDATPRADRGGPAAPGRGGAETILVVEDQAHVLELTKMSLEEHGHRVITARSGEEAITVVGEHQGPIHLLVSDIVLPGLNGRELFRRLKGLRPGLKVIYISGYAVEVLGRDGGLEPDTPFLKKPFSAGQLASMVRAALSGED